GAWPASGAISYRTRALPPPKSGASLSCWEQRDALTKRRLEPETDGFVSSEWREWRSKRRFPFARLTEISELPCPEAKWKSTRSPVTIGRPSSPAGRRRVSVVAWVGSVSDR